MKEAWKLALDALEYWDVHGMLHQPTEEAITALRLAIDVQNMASESTYKEALAQQADHSEQHLDMVKAQQEPWCMKMNGCKTKCEDCPVEVAQQEPVAWKTMEAKYPSLEKLDIRMGDGSILCDVWPQSDGDFWWAGSGTGEKFIDPKYADVTHWRVHSDTTPPQPEERNFCSRCGKRTADLTVIHTCTPPQENT